MTRRIIDKYIPMTETAFYILLALRNERHGYGILGHVEKITDHRVRLGAGTIYGTLSKMEKDKLITVLSERDRRKTYIITDLGKEILDMEVRRLNELLENAGKEIIS